MAWVRSMTRRPARGFIPGSIPVLAPLGDSPCPLASPAAAARRLAPLGDSPYPLASPAAAARQSTEPPTVVAVPEGEVLGGVALDVLQLVLAHLAYRLFWPSPHQAARGGHPPPRRP